MEGRVRVEGLVGPKAGTLVRDDAKIHVQEPEGKYASRGGLKLEAALAAFGLEVTGSVVLDAGASAGGFTDCLLQRGASRVYAVDVGYGQLRGRLAVDPRVVNWERTNVSDISRDELEPPIQLCVFDLSYLSISLALPILARLFVGAPDVIGLIKPLYERVERSAMQDRQALLGALGRVAAAAEGAGLTMTDIIASPILGSHGAVEFLGRFRTESDRRAVPAAEHLATVVETAVRLCDPPVADRRP